MVKKKKQFSSDEKLQIVMEGMRQDTTLTEVCRRYGVYHSDYYRWRDRVFSGAKEKHLHPL